MKDTGTLKEICVQEGDTVMHAKSGQGYEVRRGTDRELWLWNIVAGGVPVADSREVYNIITRVSKSPVRVVTQTVASKEIVPGVYGSVVVSGDGHIMCKWVLEAAELSAAITTLTEIRDAMESASGI